MSCLQSFDGVPSRLDRSGVALVATLSLIVIASLMLVVFVSSMQLDRSATFGYSQSMRADAIGQGALRQIVAELRREMEKDAAPDTSGGSFTSKPVFLNVYGTNFQMQGVGTNAAMTNLIKTSTNSPFFVGSRLTSALRASTLSTTVASQNNRAVKLARWNLANLGAFASNLDAPCWVVVTRNGPTNGLGIPFGSTGGTIQNSVSTNSNYAIGRFAYAIYDVGGLLDINAAGHPSSVTGAKLQAIKSSQAGADLTVTGLGLNADALIAWRNGQSGTSADTYTNYITSIASTNGFRRVQPGDNAFFNRQDLIKAAKKGVAGLNVAALPHLTVFSRERNAPAWGPMTNAPVGSLYNYRNNANVGNSTNRFLPNVRYPGSYTITTYHDNGASDSYNAVAGDPVPMKRFSLARLAWVGRNGPQNGGTDKNIQDCFGLIWDTSTKVWRYVGPTGTTIQDHIERLDEVATEKREPNFFELLQAAILSGSLGRDNGGYQSGHVGDANFFYKFQKNNFLHLLTLGANIIDQYDDDSYPTVIAGKDDTPAHTVVRTAGSEALPYFVSFKEIAGKSPDNAMSHALYLLVSLWNPSTKEVATGAVPNVRVHLQGGYHQDCGWAVGASNVSPYPYPAGTGSINSWITINTGSYALFDTKRPLSDTLVGALVNNWELVPAMPSYSTRLVGYRFPDVPIDSSPARVALMRASTNPSRDWDLVNYLGTSSNPFVLSMEFEAQPGVWIPYSFSSGNDSPSTWRVGGAHSVAGSYVDPGTVASPKPVQPNAFNQKPQMQAGIMNFKIDPRSSRFNEIQYDYDPGKPGDLTDYMTVPLTTMGATAEYQILPLLFSTVDQFVNQNWRPSCLAFNNGTTAAAQSDFYKDIDGIQRIADYGLFANNSPAVSAYDNANRPIVLNRPFQSVAELGYVFRDVPWKSLDFFTDKSGDAGLLEVFSLTEQPAIRAGVLNLNTRDETVLSAMFGSTASASTYLSATATDKLISRADLTRIILDATKKVKKDREEVARSLVDCGQARTWNVMIDLIAQAGKYPPTATAANQFIVEGERRYWLHVAIDRYTGEVVDQQLEVVYDF